MTRSRTGAALMLLGMFVLGGLLGGALTSYLDGSAAKRRRERPRPTYVDRLTADLGLSDGQRDSVRAVLDRHQPAMDSLWQAVRPLFQSERQAVRNEIVLHLTTEQQAKFTQLQRQDSIRRAEMERKRNARQ